jgi:hypothetical protein
VDYQIWCLVYEADAIFVHTPNPKRDNFPFQLSESEDRMKLSPQFREWLASTGYDWFCHKWEPNNEICYEIILYDRNCGVPVRKG